VDRHERRDRVESNMMTIGMPSTPSFLSTHASSQSLLLVLRHFPAKREPRTHTKYKCNGSNLRV